MLGAIDGTLISIKTPTEDEHLFVSRKDKRGHSVNILAISNADLKFTYPGATNDSFIWNNCNLNEKFENEIADGWLLGDSGYA